MRKASSSPPELLSRKKYQRQRPLRLWVEDDPALRDKRSYGRDSDLRIKAGARAAPGRGLETKGLQVPQRKHAASWSSVPH